MYSIVLLSVVSCVLSLLFTPLVRSLATRLGIVDKPDNFRKVHRKPIPRVGGVAVVLSVVGAYGVLALLHMSSLWVIKSELAFVLSLSPALAVIFFTGLADDIFGLRPLHKLFLQMMAAGMVWFAGVRIDHLLGVQVPFYLSLPITVFWIAACTNSVNLIDGIDGLATGVSLFATLAMLGAAILHGNVALALATAALAGALIGFLRYNFSPASIFLGDSGSLTIGFLLGSYAIVWSEKSTGAFGMLAPILALSVPLFDTFLAIIRRYLRQQPIFSADRGHIHHKLLARGLAHKHVALVFYGVCFLVGAASLLFTAMRDQYGVFLSLIVALAFLLGVQHLGYKEFEVAMRMILQGAFRRRLHARLVLLDFQSRLSNCMTVEEIWKLLSNHAPEFGFPGMAMCLDGNNYQRGENGGWQVRIDVPGRGYMVFSRGEDTRYADAMSMLFLDSITESLCLESDVDRLEAVS